MDKVVKCNIDQCGKHFMHTEKDTKCPFCHTEYVEVEKEKPKKQSEEKLEEGSDEKPKDRKVNLKVKKESFKMWKED